MATPASSSTQSSSSSPDGAHDSPPPHHHHHHHYHRVHDLEPSSRASAATTKTTSPSSEPSSSSTWATAADWAKFRPVITRHYQEENMKLKDLMSFMDRRYDFRATPKMFKDRLSKWGIAKNIKTSDIHTLHLWDTKHQQLGPQQQSPSPHPPPGFLVVGGRWIRSDRLQQSLERRAAAARRAMLKQDVLLYHQPTAPAPLRVPEQILYHSHVFVQGLLDGAPFFSSSSSFSPPPQINLQGPVQRLRLTFEETIGNLHLLPTAVRNAETTRLAFCHLDQAFGLIRPCLTANDPQLVLVLTQLLALCLYCRRPEIMRMLLAYLRDLARLVLGDRHPLTVICGDLSALSRVQPAAASSLSSSTTTTTTTKTTKKKTTTAPPGLRTRDEGNNNNDDDDDDKDEAANKAREEDMMAKMNETCRVVAEACWRQFATQLYHQPDQMDAFVHLTAAYGDVLDSLGRADENEAFLRHVVEDMMTTTTTTTTTTTERRQNHHHHVQMEMHLILALRRRARYPEALARLARIRAAWESDERGAAPPPPDEELAYTVLRIHGLCEIGGGSVARGRALLWEAFELMQRTKGKYSPRTTRALREVVRWGEPDEALVRDLEDRLARFSLETENFL